MKAILVFLFCVLGFGLVASAQKPELIVLGVAGYNKTNVVSEGNFGAAQVRLMIPVFPQLRIGPYLGYTKYTSTELIKTPHPFLMGEEFSYGLSFDSYGHLSYSYSYYAWINGGIKNVKDNFNDGTFKSVTKTNEGFVSGGLFITDDWQGWFGNNRIMFDYQRPLNSDVTATWKGELVKDVKAYNKESYRFVAVSGIKRIGKGSINFEPVIHLGYGKDCGRTSYNTYLEYGGGIEFGVMKDYYHNILAIKAFQKSYTNAEKVFCVEVVFSPSSLIQGLRKKSNN